MIRDDGSEVPDIGICGKKVYSKILAQTLLNDIVNARSTQKGRRGKPKRAIRARRCSREKRIYYCKWCNGWHLSSHDKFSEMDKRDKEDGY